MGWRLRRKKVLIAGIDRKTIEASLEYLACPSDFGELRLDIPKVDSVEEGEFECTECGKKYEIRNGVPYFFEKGNGFEWSENLSLPEIAESIASTANEQEISWSKILALGILFQKKRASRREAIDDIFSVVTDAIDLSRADKQTVAFLMQAATASRYDIENYRGTFTLPVAILDFLAKSYSGKGVIVEGASATGECLYQVSRQLNPGFSVGVDISGSLVRVAQRSADPNILFVQGDIRNLPLKSSIAGLYVLNNVFDRVENPRRASLEAGRILLPKGSYFALSNCDPLQYGYTTKSGLSVVFVPEENQLSLEDGLNVAGFSSLIEQRGVWNIETAAYGREALPYKSMLGRR